MTSIETARPTPSRGRLPGVNLSGLAAMIAALVLAACGGGGSSSGQGAEPLDGTGRSQALAADQSSEPDMDVAADPGWAFLANENEPFSVQGTQTVRYGNGSSWLTATVSGSAQCSNAYFGRDPIVGTWKHCEVAAAWTTVAAEGQAFSVSGTQTVRYGNGTSWFTKVVTGAGQCTNGFFGGDPIYGVVKQCQSTAAAADPSWQRVAGEGQSFSVAGLQTVRYGSGGSWVTQVVRDSGQCTNGFFGTDPAYGVAKECDVSTTPPAATSPPPATAGVCTPPVDAVDTSAVAANVGNGTPASCTEAALRAAIASRDIVTFNCGAAPVTISVGSQIDLPTDRNLVIDGGGKVTLDGGGRTRILSMIRNNYRTNRQGLTLQHIALQNGRAPGTGYVAPDPNRPQCAFGYAGGAGGAIEVRDARLYVIDADFRNNASATPGPDVGGGAVYASGSLDVAVVGSRFSGNSGSVGGAIGLLQSNGRLVNSSFDGNSANGTSYHGTNGDYSQCAGVAYQGQGGAGGAGGAVSVDGSDDTDLLVCGDSFTNNQANENAGALTRTPNNSPRRTTIDRSLFQGNRARQAGALFALNSGPLEIIASTFSNNSAVGFGAAQIEGGRLSIVNSTFSGNEATQGVGGALMLNSLDAQSSIRNVTFAGNKSMAGSGFFSAAIYGQINFPVDNTVFANNLTADGGSPMQCTFTPANGSSDMQWPRNHAFGGAPDTLCVNGIAFADPALGALGNNGGPTLTLQPSAASPLRGAGRNCPATDQRGQPRNTSQCTIGAVE